MKLTDLAWSIFNQSINDYHLHNNPAQPIQNPYDAKTDVLKYLLYEKNWIDTIQWHYEDLIRDEDINPVAALDLKRKIDASNQERTDLVEYIDSWFLDKYKNITPKPNAKINTESPAWAIDRFSILALKVYHMDEEANRKDASETHRQKCQEKLQILKTQKEDLATAIEELLEDIENGHKYMKVYKQMKMYNDEELNPILYKKQ